VQATAQSAGWILMFCDSPLPEHSALETVTREVAQHAVCAPESVGVRRNPIGFGGEMYSELARIASKNDLNRILARYPITEVQLSRVRRTHDTRVLANGHRG